MNIKLLEVILNVVLALIYAGIMFLTWNYALTVAFHLVSITYLQALAMYGFYYVLVKAYIQTKWTD